MDEPNWADMAKPPGKSRHKEPLPGPAEKMQIRRSVIRPAVLPQPPKEPPRHRAGVAVEIASGIAAAIGGLHIIAGILVFVGMLLGVLFGSGRGEMDIGGIFSTGVRLLVLGSALFLGATGVWVLRDLVEKP